MPKKKNEMTVASLTSLPVTKKAVDLTSYGSGGGFLKRLQLINSQSKVVAKGLIAPGRYAIVEGEDNVLDLGDTVDVLPFAVRDKAMDMSGEKPIVCYDVDSDLYKDIMERSDVKDSHCVFGPSFLILERTTGRFLEFYLGNKSGRISAEAMSNFLPISEAQATEFGLEAREPLQTTLSGEFIEKPKFSWYAAKIGACSTPFAELPPIEEIFAEVEKFVNPEEAATEVATTGGRTR